MVERFAAEKDGRVVFPNTLCKLAILGFHFAPTLFSTIFRTQSVLYSINLAFSLAICSPLPITKFLLLLAPRYFHKIIDRKIR